MKKRSYLLLFIVLAILLLQTTAFALTDEIITDTGDTAFVMICAALVFFMTPGLALFYGGMVRKKNILNTMMNSYVIIGLISIQWVLVGYSLSFGTDNGGLIGSFDWIGLNGIGADPNLDYAATIPHSAFVIYQMMFAIITPALITGAFAERLRFSVLLIFSLIWSTLVYDPLAHMVWGIGGFLRNLGALDFAGGNVVHISSGVAGLVIALVIGKRKDFKSVPIVPHNIPFIVIGASILWLGWFGFNSGSALGANGLAVNAFLVTNTSAASAMISWIVIEWIVQEKPTLLGAATGAVVGLVAITPAAGYVNAMSSIIIGLLVSPICFFFISFVKQKFGYDDSLDAFGCHGVGGIWGALATGLFASKDINPAGANGLFYGNPSQLGIQALSVIFTIAVSAILTFVIIKGISLFMKLRVEESDEEEGLDIALHGENAYADFLPAFANASYGSSIPEIQLLKNENDETVPVEIINKKRNKGVKMTKVVIITNQNKFTELKDEMNKIGITGMTAINVLGCGVQKGYFEYYRGVKVDMNLLPKIQIEIVVSKVPVRLVIETAKKVLHTGHIGDGKIFVYDVENAVKIRTGEEGYDALQDEADMDEKILTDAI